MRETVGRRLNSWKEIAAYVQRDVRTVARWEKDRGLPVHRVPGSRGQVFAFTDQIDGWLTCATGQDATNADEPRRDRARVLSVAAIVSAMAVLVAAAVPSLRDREPIVAIDAQHHELVARTRTGEAWRYAFDSPVRIGVDAVRIADLDGNGLAEILVVVGHPALGPYREILYCFSSSGRLLWQRSVDAAVTFGAGRFEGPWNSGPLHAFRTGSGWRIAWLTHHHTWWPSHVTLFDGSGTIKGQFVHAGWITEAAGLQDGRVIVSGVSNQHDADVTAVLDSQSWDGSGPPLEGAYACHDCPPGKPLRYFVLPRSELSRAASTTRQKAQIHVVGGRIHVRIVQALEGNAEIIHDFSPDFELQRIRPSDSYWAWHAALEAAGRIKHAAASCPERDGFEVRRWDREKGWSTVTVPGDGPR